MAKNQKNISILKKKSLTNGLYLIIFIALILLITPILSASKEKYYNSYTKTVSLKDNNQDIANIKLLTPLIYYVPIGYNKIAEFEIDGKTNINDFINKIDAYDVKRNMNKKNIQFDYKYYTIIGTEKVNDYDYVCSGSYENKTNICEYKIIGTHIENVYGYLPYNNSIYNKKIKIALFTNVNEGDKIEWIPTFNGVEVSEWAIYESVKIEMFNETTPNPVSNNYLRGSCYQPNKKIIITGFAVNTTNTANQCVLQDCCGYTDKCGSTIATGTMVDDVCVFSTTPVLNIGQNYSLGYNDIGGGTYTFFYGTTYGINRTNLNETIYSWGHISSSTTTVYPNMRLDIMNITSKALTNVSILLNSPVNNSFAFANKNQTFNCSINSENQLKNISLWTNLTGLVATNDTLSLGIYNTTGIFSYNMSDSFKWNCQVCDILDKCFYAENNNTNILSNFIEDSVFYSLNTTEGSIETFNLNISISNQFTFNTAYLVYNNTRYLSTFSLIGTTSDSKQYKLINTVNIPFIPAITNKNFYWEITFDNMPFNSSTRTQTINKISIDNCTSYTNLLYNFTFYDQENLSRINSTLDLNINIAPYGTSNYFLNFSNSFTLTQDKKICLSIPLNNSIYSIYITAGYQGSGYVKQFYFLDNGTLTNATDKEVKLYDLLLTSSTSFLVSYKDEAGNPVPDAIIHVWRYYIGEGLYREVENGKLDSTSSTHLHLTEEDVIYYFTVTYKNQMIYTSPSYNAICLSSPCNIVLSASTPYTPFSTSWYYVGDTYISAYSNKSARMVYVNFISNSVHDFNITLVTINDGNKQIINSTSLISSAGTLSFYVPYPYGNQTFYVDTYIDNTLVKSFSLDLSTSAKDLFGSFGLFLIILMIASLILIASSDGVLAIIFAIIGLIIAVTLYILDMGWITLISIIIAGGLIAWKITQRKR